MSIEDLFDRKERHILKEILEVLERIERRLHPHFTLRILPGGHMASVVAGQSASFFLAASASDGSTAVIANPILTADDSSVTVETDSSDPSGASFVVTVPASDTGASFNLNAKADVSSNTAPSQQVSASLEVSIQPATQPVTFTLTINQK